MTEDLATEDLSSTSMNRSATIALTGDDYAAANKLHVLNYQRRRGPLIAMAFCVVLYLLWAFFADTRSSGIPDAVVHAVFLSMFALPIVNYLLIAPYAARKTFRQQKTLHHPVTYSWSETGLKVSSVNGEWLVPWIDYLKWTEDASMLLFYQAPRLFQMLPKRALTVEQLADLRQCAGRSGP